VDIPVASPPDRGLKLSRETAKVVPAVKLPRTVSGHIQRSSNPSTAPQVGPSTVKATAIPQYVPNSQEEKLVLPPMPTGFFEELTTFPNDFDSSLTEPKTSKDEVCTRGGLAK
jgi:hypothetical protein